jgi:GAF domain-containing protein
MDEAHEVADRIGRLAAVVGPALAPVDHELQLTEMAEVARAVFGAEACSIALLDADEENLVFTAASGAGAEAVIGLTVPVGVGIAGWVVGAGQSIEITEVARDPRFARDVAERTGYLPRAILAAPLETDDRVLGVVEVLDRDADRPGSDRDLVLLDFFASHAAVAVESARLFGDMGRLLLAALAGADSAGDMRPALDAAARALNVDTDLADLAGLFGELGRTGAAERRLAVRVMSQVLAYAEQRPPA